MLIGYGRQAPRSLPGGGRPPLGHDRRRGAMGVTQPAVSTQIARLEESGRLPAVRAGRRPAEADGRGPAVLCRSKPRAGRGRPPAGRDGADPRGPVGPAGDRQPSLGGDLAAARPGGRVPRRAAGRVGAADLAPFRRGEPAPADARASTSASPSCRSTRVRSRSGVIQMRCVAILPPRHPLASRKVLTPELLSGRTRW